MARVRWPLIAMATPSRTPARNHVPNAGAPKVVKESRRHHDGFFDAVRSDGNRFASRLVELWLHNAGRFAGRRPCFSGIADGPAVTMKNVMRQGGTIGRLEFAGYPTA